MTTEEILQGNKLIAEFMGAKWNKTNGWNFNMFASVYTHCGNDLKFNKSWDWLMPVVEKIDSLGFWVEIVHSVLGTTKRQGKINWCEIVKENHTDLLRNDCDTEIARGEGETKLEAVYNAILEFITWHNKQN